MEVIHGIVRMNGNVHGANSYANNSILQRVVISKTRIMVERAIQTMHLNKSFPENCFTMADLGCSYGPNTLLSVSHIMEAIAGLYESPLELQVFLNDLPTNDFNSVFMSLPDLFEKKGCATLPCYISGMPGSFYGRLFPISSLHLVHSSYSLQWLSQVPRGIENNKGHIYMAKTSPSNVFEAYLNQFQTDFGNFLSNRAKEMKPGGAMILTFIGRSSDDPKTNDCCLFWELLSKSLLDMASEGMVEESDVDSFNIPNYYPSKREVKEIVEREGSFIIDEMDSFGVNWGASYGDNELEENSCGRNMANCIRAVSETMLTSQFGEGVMDELFGRYAKYIGDHLAEERTMFFNIVISMSKKN
nr:salicylic acid methyltransferase [Geranium robertianum]